MIPPPPISTLFPYTTLFRSPSKDYEASYRSLLEEFSAQGERLIPFPLSFPHENFPELIARLEEGSKGLGLPDGFVAHSTYWLVTDSEILGVSNLRHSLTPALRKEGGNIGYGVRPTARRQGYGSELLRRTLQRAKDLGLAKVLLTCGKANLGIRGVRSEEERGSAKILDRPSVA